MTLAGGPMPGFQDGTAVEARFHEPSAIAALSDGRVLVLEAGNDRLRLLLPDGTTTTVGPTNAEGPEPPFEGTTWPEGGLTAGDGEGIEHFPKMDHPTLEKLRTWEEPAGLTVGSQGDWFVADTGQSRLWTIDPSGRARWVAGAVHPSFYVGREKATLFEFEGPIVLPSFREALISQGWRDGLAKKSRFKSPQGLAERSDGTLIVADSGNGCLRLVHPDGQVETIQTYAEDPDLGGTPLRIEGCGGLRNPVGLALGIDGTLFVSDKTAHRILTIDPKGTVRSYAGCGEPGFTDGVGDQAAFREPAGIAIDHVGGLWVADSGNHAVRYVSPDGSVKTIAGQGMPGHRDGAGQSSLFSRPWGISIASTGAVAVADRENHLVRLISRGPVPVLEADEFGILYLTEVLSGQRRERPPQPTRLTDWHQFIGREVRTVVKDYENDLIRIYFRDVWAEIEGVGQTDPIPYFFYDEVGEEFHFVASHLAGRTVVSIRLGSPGTCTVGATEDSEPDREFPYVEWAAFEFDDGTTEWLRSYAGDGIKLVTGDPDAFYLYAQR